MNELPDSGYVSTTTGTFGTLCDGKRHDERQERTALAMVQAIFHAPAVPPVFCMFEVNCHFQIMFS